MRRNDIVKWVIPSGLIEPKGLCLRAVILLVFFLFCHIAGWRDSTMVLSGTRPAGDQAAVQGVLYVIAHLGVTVLAPILVLGAVILSVLKHCIVHQQEGAK